MSDDSQKVFIGLADMTPRRARELHRIREKRVEYRLELSWRGSNDPQNFPCCGLLFHCRGELTLTIVKLFGRFSELLAQLRIGLCFFSHRLFHHGTAQFFLFILRTLFGGDCHKNKQTDRKYWSQDKPEDDRIGLRCDNGLPQRLS